MNFYQRIQSSLTFKAAILFGAAALIASIFVVLLSAASERTDRNGLAQAHGLALANASAASLAPALIAENLHTAEAALRQLENQPGVLSLRVLNPTGTVLISTTPRIIGQPGLANTTFSRVLSTGRPGVHVQGGALHSVIPVFDKGHLAAIVYHVYDLTLNQPSMRHLIIKSAWKGLVVIGAALPVALLVFMRLMSPLADLNRAASQAAAGDLTVRLNARRSDELGVLSTSFNTMLERLKVSFDRARWLAYGDELTRLANKVAFNERLQKLIAPGQQPGAIMLIDIDGFKRFNDAYGQDEGDRILKIIAQRLRKVLQARILKFSTGEGGARPLLARFSGDEFGILVPGARSAPEIQAMASDILEAIAVSINLSGHNACLSARIGIALYPHDAADARLLISSANFAIDEAKKDGGGTLRFFEPSMSQKAMQHMTLQNELRRALAENELVVHYQPKIDVRKGTIAGCEALVRWQQPSGKLVGPSLFIEAAEESGLIREIGDFVLGESCRAAVRWEKEGYSCSVAVNVSALQFASNDFTGTVFNALKTAGLPASKLELELTESVAMTDPERMLEQIGPLREQGVRFAIDDFGTGHSSLAYLTRLPFDVFKIDQSFVQAIAEDKHARVIVQTVLAMAESLGYSTVAEGVETREHFAFLQLHCCDYVQGYYFARPMPEQAFLDMLRAERENLAHAESPGLAEAV